MLLWTTALLILATQISLCPPGELAEHPSVPAATLERPTLRSGPDWVVFDQSPINGKVSLLATDPHNAGRLYAYGPGDIFRSDDFGQTWTSLNQDLKPYLLRVDPSMADRLYVLSGGSIWRSADAGSTWNRIAGPPNSVSSLLVDAAGTLYAVGLEGTFKNSTAGDNWSPVTSGGRTLLAADSLTPGVLYALSGYPSTPESIFKTTDGASSWMGPIFTLPFVQELGDFKISSTPPLTVYLITSLRDLSVCVDIVYASRDSGESWKAIFTSAAVWSIVVDPVRPNVLYAGTLQCGSSPDPGGVYQLSSTGRFAPLGRRGFAAQTLAVAPDGSILYAIAGGKLAILRLPSHPTPAAEPFR